MKETALYHRFVFLTAIFVVLSFLLNVVAAPVIVGDLPNDEDYAFKMIANAMNPEVKKIYFATHILATNDMYSIFLLAALVNAANNGAEVIGIVDNELGHNQETPFHRGEANPFVVNYLKENGVKIGFFNPISKILKEAGVEDSLLDLLKRPLNLIKGPRAFMEVNRRWHDKIAVFFFDKNGSESDIVIKSDKNMANEYNGIIKKILPNVTTFHGRSLTIQGGGLSREIKKYFEFALENRNIVFPDYELGEHYQKSDQDKIFTDQIEKVRDALSKMYSDKWDNEKIPKLEVLDYADHDTVKVEISKILESLDPRLNRKYRDFYVDDSDIEYITDIYYSDIKTKKVLKVSTLQQIFQKIYDAPRGTKIYIENPYFILFPQLEKLLKHCQENDKKIVLMTVAPAVADSDHVQEASEVDIGKIAKYGVEVHQLLEMTHAKLVQIIYPGNRPPLLITGSANWDHRSYTLNSESAVGIKGQEIVVENIKRFWDRINQVGAILAAKNGIDYTESGIVKHILTVARKKNKCVSVYRPALKNFINELLRRIKIKVKTESKRYFL